MNDQEIENEVNAKGLNVAPRVTKEQIDALMARVIFTYDQPNGTTSTLAHAFLDGKFLLATGHSACVSADNFDAALGQRMARSKAEAAARDELWKLEGYALFKSPRTQNPKRYTWADVATHEIQHLVNHSDKRAFASYRVVMRGESFAHVGEAELDKEAIQNAVQFGGSAWPAMANAVIANINRQVAESEKLAFASDWAAPNVGERELATHPLFTHAPLSPIMEGGAA